MNIYCCNLCDKSIKIKSKKKHSNSQYHKSSSMNIIPRYNITNLEFLHIEDKLKNCIRDYDKKFAFHKIICKYKLHFSGTINSAKSHKWCNISI